MGIVLILASIGHILVMLARAAALLVLAVTTPISAAGLVSDVGRSWFWKSLRWVHAAALTPVLMILVLGLGIQVSTGVAMGLTDTTQEAIATALPAVMMICVGCISPLALFKLLAFVDPGTNSGAAMRAGMASNGGVGQMLNKLAGSGDGGSDVASQSGSDGRSQGESSADEATKARFAGSAGGSKTGAGSKGGAVRGLGAIGNVAGTVMSIGTRASAIGVDLSNQMGVGHQTYHPDFASVGSHKPSHGRNGNDTSGGGDGGQDDQNPPPFPGGRRPPDPDPQPQPDEGGREQGQSGQGAAPSSQGESAAAEPPAPPVPNAPIPPEAVRPGAGRDDQDKPNADDKPSSKPDGPGGGAAGGAAEGAVVA